LEARIVEKIGRVPRSYAEVTYDEFLVAALTLKNYTAAEEHGIGSLQDALVKTANSYVGITGSTELNDAGDRKYGSYDFWLVRPVDKDVKGTVSFEWANVTAYRVGN
jgi:ABC-type branched-subunit amino acid transport system substrate-binding protein